MNTISLSFGKKIPISQCQIKNTETRKFVPATFYELDCHDESDMDELKDLKGKWHFLGSIYYNMLAKNAYYQKTQRETPNKFYILENDKKEIVGLCQVENRNNNIFVNLLESAPDKKYKYVGQTMLASMGNQVLNNGGQQLTIKHPTLDAYEFYIKKCKFKRHFNSDLKMNQSEIEGLIKRTEKRTHGEIIKIES